MDWKEEAIDLLKTGAVTHIILDHDLGDNSDGTGSKPPHSANSSARQKMQSGVGNIIRNLHV